MTTPNTSSTHFHSYSSLSSSPRHSCSSSCCHSVLESIVVVAASTCKSRYLWQRRCRLNAATTSQARQRHSSRCCFITANGTCNSYGGGFGSGCRPNLFCNQIKVVATVRRVLNDKSRVSHPSCKTQDLAQPTSGLRGCSR